MGLALHAGPSAPPSSLGLCRLSVAQLKYCSKAGGSSD